LYCGGPSHLRASHEDSSHFGVLKVAAAHANPPNGAHLSTGCHRRCYGRLPRC
jgi:hypothetical protein